MWGTVKYCHIPTSKKKKCTNLIPSHSEFIPSSFRVIPTNLWFQKKNFFTKSKCKIPTKFRPNSESILGPFRVHSDQILTKFRPNSESIPSQFRVNSESIPSHFRVNSESFLSHAK